MTENCSWIVVMIESDYKERMSRRGGKFLGFFQFFMYQGFLSSISLGLFQQPKESGDLKGGFRGRSHMEGTGSSSTAAGGPKENHTLPAEPDTVLAPCGWGIFNPLDQRIWADWVWVLILRWALYRRVLNKARWNGADCFPHQGIGLVRMCIGRSPRAESPPSKANQTLGKW